MQKFIIVLAFILGFAAAAPQFTNVSWSVAPAIVATSANDSALTNGQLRLVSSGNDLLLQGLAADNNGTTAGAQKTVATKDLTASKVSNISVTTATNLDDNSVVYRDSIVQVAPVQDTNKVTQINVRRYKLTNGASDNAVAVTTFKNDSTLVVLGVNVHTHSNKVYTQVLQTLGGNVSLLLVGTDVDGKNAKTVTLATGSVDAASCAGISGSDKLYCAWRVGTSLVEASVDPTKDQNVNNTNTTVNGVDANAKLIAWSTSAAVGTIQVVAGQTESSTSYKIRSVNTNTTQDLKTTGSATLSRGNIFPRNDNLTLVWKQEGNANSYIVQVVNRNGSEVNQTNLVTGADIFQLVQHKNGAVYGLAAPADKSVVYVGQVQGDIHLSAFTLQAAVYACFALVAALFVF